MAKKRVELKDIEPMRSEHEFPAGFGDQVPTWGQIFVMPTIAIVLAFAFLVFLKGGW